MTELTRRRLLASAGAGAAGIGLGGAAGYLVGSESAEAEAAFEAVEPLLSEEDPELAQEIDALAEELSQVPAQIVQ